MQSPDDAAKHLGRDREPSRTRCDLEVDLRARPDRAGRLDERAAGRDVDECHRTPGPHRRVQIRDGRRIESRIETAIGYLWIHRRPPFSKANNLTRPVAPRILIAYCRRRPWI